MQHLTVVYLPETRGPPLEVFVDVIRNHPVIQLDSVIPHEIPKDSGILQMIPLRDSNDSE